MRHVFYCMAAAWRHGWYSLPSAPLVLYFASAFLIFLCISIYLFISLIHLICLFVYVQFIYVLFVSILSFRLFHFYSPSFLFCLFYLFSYLCFISVYSFIYLIIYLSYIFIYCIYWIRLYLIYLYFYLFLFITLLLTSHSLFFSSFFSFTIRKCIRALSTRLITPHRPAKCTGARKIIETNAQSLNYLTPNFPPLGRHKGGRFYLPR